jgi:hypothetical protein
MWRTILARALPTETDLFAASTMPLNFGVLYRHCKASTHAQTSTAAEQQSCRSASTQFSLLQPSNPAPAELRFIVIFLLERLSAMSIRLTLMDVSCLLIE